MAIKYILFNPYAGNGKCQKGAEELQKQYENSVLINMNRISSYKTFFEGLDADDDIVICGGDGTLNIFANDTKDVDYKNKVFYYAMGTGNDFSRDIGHASLDKPDFCISDYIKNLPTVEVNGKNRVFLNGVGYGIDGYCCEVGDALREQNEKKKTEKPINYTSIAIKGLLFYFKPRNAKAVVDGKEYSFKKVWIAPTMNGRYYGGGMMPTPAQDRLRKDGKLSLMLFHGTGKLQTLMIFPSLFKGEHIKHTKHITILEGSEITVTFDRPTPLQIDGETVLDVTTYTVHAASHDSVKSEPEKANA